MFTVDLKEPNFRTGLTPTKVNRLRTEKFHNLSQTPAGAQMSTVINYLLPLLFPSVLDIKEALILHLLRMVL